MNTCSYCGNEADHACGGAPTCNTCCGIFGSLPESHPEVYDLIRVMRGRIITLEREVASKKSPSIEGQKERLDVWV